VEMLPGPSAEIIWGETGQHFTPLNNEALHSAKKSGHLVMLD
jgi:hypothetical protein